jgi:hypothetical protein
LIHAKKHGNLSERGFLLGMEDVGAGTDVVSTVGGIPFNLAAEVLDRLSFYTNLYGDEPVSSYESFINPKFALAQSLE